MSKHTPGPWAEDGNCITAENGKLGIAIIEPEPSEDFWDGIGCVLDFDTMKANARLIAAAPDLLAVCEALAERGAVIATTGLGEQLAAAISKAQGEPS